MRTDTPAVTATGSWSIYKWGWQFSGSQALDEAHVPFFGAFGAAWDDAMVARWSASPLGMLSSEMKAVFVTLGGGGSPAAASQPVVTIAAVQSRGGPNHEGRARPQDNRRMMRPTGRDSETRTSPACCCT